MDELSPEQYETVLKYMETVNEDSFQIAAQTLSQHNYNLQRAVDSRFGNNPPPRQQNPVDDQQIVRRYMEYIQRRNAEWSPLGAVFDFIKALVLGILSLVIRIFPTSLSTRYFGSDFEKLYQGQVAYRHRKLKAQLKQTKNLSSRSVLLVISPRQRHRELIALLQLGAVRQKIEKDFFLSCYVAGNSELQGIQGADKAPQIIALRMNIFEQIVVIGRTEDPKGVNEEQLVKWAHDGRNLFRRDGNVLVKYRNFVARFYGHNYEEEEEEEVNLVQRQQESHEIRQQNEAYQRIEQQARINSQLMEEKRKKEEEQAKQMEELLQERQIRKMSIPDEPTAGPIVRISFRCPDGSTIFRNFSADEKLELVYHWVELNEEIEFQDSKRQFQIMYSYPPQPLSSRKEQLLSQVFDSPQQKVVIREL